ncbi:MAG: CRTAC1 family protein [Planctomycetes bacterium]|nr:CRTAC1 family protein [Planctomycetota bacterium]MBL7040100.1 CRTAC1 family protein [Pirellulaceae bacterium]
MEAKTTVQFTRLERIARLLVSALPLAILLSTSALHAADQTLPVFADVTQDAGITAKHSYGDDRLTNIVEGTGAGAMFFDYDSDGWLDIYLPCGCWLPEVNDNRGRKYRDKLANHLYRNNRDGTFTDVTDQAGVGDKGYGVGTSAADFDDDGDLDLYVLNYGKNVLYRNNGNGTFTDISEQSGLDDSHWSLSAPWFDFDGDGDLDVYVVNYLEFDPRFRDYYAPQGYPGPRSYSGQQDALYRNNGNGTFTDVTETAGLINPDGRGMSGTVADLNNDGLLDLYVTNDAMENYFYRNTGNGTYVEEGLIMGLAFGEGGQNVSSMGPAVGDVDRDGWLDIYIPDMGYGCLLLNREDYFEDQTAPSKLAVICGQYIGWGGVLFDYDNDGFLDLFVANGDAHREYTEEDVLLRNDGTGVFKDIAADSGDYFRKKYVGRGASSGDFDNDGDIDLLVVNLNDTPRLLRNDGGNKNNWLTVAVKLRGGKSDAVGARVTVKTGDLTQIHDVMPVTGYLSQADPRAHFGLGRAEKVDVEVRWPDGATTGLKDVSANQILMVEQDAK